MKSLLLIFVLSGHAVLAQVPQCTELRAPAPGEATVSVATDFSWDAAAGATGYLINAGTSSGGSDILNAVDVGAAISYDLPADLPPLTSIYVSIIPYNAMGNNLGCAEVVFDTAGNAAPSCTEIINPTDGDALVSTTANITWIRDFGATGYLMTVFEKDPNGILIWNRVDVGNGTNAKPPDFKPRTRYFVTIIPYNSFGEAQGCQAITFTTGDGPPLPACTQLTSPRDGAAQIAIDTGLEWAAVSGIEGYLVSVGTTPRGTDIIDRFDTGLDTRYDLPNDLPLGTRIYVLVTTYAKGLESEDCMLTSFVTETPNADAFSDIIPEFFTPNNDGFNDDWGVSSPDNFTIENVFVFDRYGKLLAQLRPDEEWNGTYNGRPLPSGSYWYSVQVADFPSIKGYFLLKR